MPVILVVDDSDTDRALIRGQLSREPMDWIVEFADSAEQAISTLQELHIDLVISDLMMPGMSGMELLDFINQNLRPLPVVLVSGQGSESLAVDAIKRGAASYVPKDSLASRLIETVKQVLEVQKSDLSYEELIEHAENMRFRFRLKNDPALIPPLIGLIQQMAYRMNILASKRSTRLGIALDEAVINAMFHGNLELPGPEIPDIRARLRDGESVEIIESRQNTRPYSDRYVTVEAVLASEMLDITIRDDGRGFDLSAMDNDQDHRGLTLIENLVDEVSFNDIGNEIRMVIYREAESAKVKPTANSNH